MSRRPSRYDLSAGRREHGAATQRLQRARTQFEAAGIPITTEVAGMMRLWSREQVTAATELRDALIDFIDTRRRYEKLIRDDAD